MTNKKEIVGTAYRQDGNLQNLKKEIVGGTNERAIKPCTDWKL